MLEAAKNVPLLELDEGYVRLRACMLHQFIDEVIIFSQVVKELQANPALIFHVISSFASSEREGKNETFAFIFPRSDIVVVAIAHANARVNEPRSFKQFALSEAITQPKHDGRETEW